ncbi:MAG: hypothetical protein IPJ75_19295 [Ignavibacteriales bacterium]|nr:hypothetical protein [Ignavibacteriales bacterium]
MSTNQKKHSLLTAITVTISTMIGTGVFTSLGFQLFDIKSVPPILALWIIGGIIATAGALTYGELTSAFPAQVVNITFSQSFIIRLWDSFQVMFLPLLHLLRQ